MRDILKHATQLTSMFGLALAVALLGTGCAPALPDPTFEAGMDEGDLGTLDDGAGTTFEVEGGDQGVARVVATDTSTGDSSSWTFDEQGRLETITAADGSVLTIERGDDGSATISVTNLTLETPFEPVSLGPQTFMLPAGTLTAKTINQRTLAGGTAVSDACALIDANCADLNAVHDVEQGKEKQALLHGILLETVIW